MKPSKTDAGSITLGYLASSLDEGAGHSLWQGIWEQCQALGINLVTFAGTELRDPRPYYHHANQVYELADSQRLDGLILWTSSLAGYVGLEGIKDLCQVYVPLPMVGIGMPLAGIPSVILDSYQGMRQAIEHLAQVHGKRRIAFLRGPEAHYDAQERLRAYRDVVAEFGLDADPNLISPPCNWYSEYAAGAMRVLVEERRMTFDSLVVVNDELAHGAMLYLREKGLRLPEDVAIVGFDNSPIGRVCTPPLTTLPNHIRQRGRLAVEMLLARINGEAVPEVVRLSTSLKVRQSCGCLDPYISQASIPLASVALPAGGASPDELRSSIIEQLQRSVIPEDSASDWPEKLLEALEASLQQQTDETFLKELHALLQPALPAPAPSGSEIRRWQTVLSELRRWVIPMLQRNQELPENIEHAERLLHQGRVMIGEMAVRSQGHQDWLRRQQLNSLHRLRLEISAAETLASLLDMLARDLPRMGISCGCLALYLTRSSTDEMQPMEGARLVLAFDQNGRLPETEGQVYAPASLLTPPLGSLFRLGECSSEGGSSNLMVHPLHVGAEQLGFLIVDASKFESSNQQVLREQISSALNNVLLSEKNTQLYLQACHNQQLAEEADALKSRFLSMVSHELLTPIVLLVGLSEMMLHEGIGGRPSLPESYRQDLTRIHASAQQLGSLVRDVLDLARSQLNQLTLVKKPLHMAEVLKPVILVSEQITHSKGLEWQVSIPEDLPLVMGDASRLQQVALNLVSNAVKFTAQGSVKLKVEVDPGSGEAGAVIVSVTDTGLSVPLAEQKSIFDEFHQSTRTVARGYGGLGIGLAICRQLIELHGGEIGVHSSGDENSGSTFYFTLPVYSRGGASLLPGTSGRTAERSEKTADRSPAGADLDEVNISQPGQIVLILTEQVPPTLPLQQYLEQQGFQVRVLDMVQNPGWLAELLAEPDSLLTEGAASLLALVLDLPAAERGWEIMEILKQHPATQDLPIIFYALQPEQEDGFISGDGLQPGSGSMLALDYLVKPVAANSLAQALQRFGLSPNGCADGYLTILIVDDDPEILALHSRMVLEHLPACQVLSANNGRAALAQMIASQSAASQSAASQSAASPLALVLLDLMMPEMDGMAVLEAMQSDPRLLGIPVIVLTAQSLSQEEMARLNQGVVSVLAKGIFTTEETLEHIEQALARNKRLGSEAQRLVRRVMAYIHENFALSIDRQALADYACVSERHLNRCFSDEIGMTALTYLNRYRIQQARKLLEEGRLTITEVMEMVGFSESSHFARVFHREVGVSPSAYKKGERRPSS